MICRDCVTLDCPFRSSNSNATCVWEQDSEHDKKEKA